MHEGHASHCTPVRWCGAGSRQVRRRRKGNSSSSSSWKTSFNSSSSSSKSRPNNPPTPWCLPNSRVSLTPQTPSHHPPRSCSIHSRPQFHCRQLHQLPQLGKPCSPRSRLCQQHPPTPHRLPPLRPSRPFSSSHPPQSSCHPCHSRPCRYHRCSSPNFCTRSHLSNSILQYSHSTLLCSHNSRFRSRCISRPSCSPPSSHSSPSHSRKPPSHSRLSRRSTWCQHSPSCLLLFRTPFPSFPIGAGAEGSWWRLCGCIVSRRPYSCNTSISFNSSFLDSFIHPLSHLHIRPASHVSPTAWF